MTYTGYYTRTIRTYFLILCFFGHRHCCCTAFSFGWPNKCQEEKRVTKWYHNAWSYSVNIISYSYSNSAEYCEPPDIILTCTWAVGLSFNLSITKKCLTTLTTFKIPDITWAVGCSFNLYMSRRTFFEHVRGFVWAWMALRAGNHAPWGLATLNPQSTCHGPRPGPNLAPWCPGGTSRRHYY